MLGLWIDLPYPPSLNTYYRTYRGRILISEPARAYRRLIKPTLWGHIGQSGISRIRPVEFDISMDILVYPPDKRKRDLDNTLKCLLDSLQHAGLYKDDSQIGKLVVERKEMVENGKVSVMINKIGDL